MTGFGSRHADRGEANALGLVMIAPVAIAVAVMVLWIGREVDTTAQVRAASSEAAQAAARQRDVGSAQIAATATAAAMLSDASACSGGPSVSIDVGDFRPGGTVTVVVTCTPDRTDLQLVSPDAATFTATATATIDSYRAAGAP
jgi:hypothetical protein